MSVPFSAPSSSATPPVAGIAASLSMRQLAYLVALSETLNFTRAAERCFVTQSTLSAGIRELEHALEVVLFERDRQSVIVTPIGRELVARARALLSAAADFVGAARASDQPLEGAFALGAIPTIAPFLLPNLLRVMRAELPHLTTVVREEQTPVLLQRVDEGLIDAAIIALPYDTGRLQTYPIFTEELWLIAGEDDPMAAQANPKVAQIDLGRLMLLGDGHCLRDHSLQACQAGTRAQRARGGPTPSPIEATSLPTLVQMVEAGLGVSLLPEMAIKAGFLAGARVIARPLASPAPQRDIVLVARSTSARSDLLLRLQELARKLGTSRAARGARRSRGPLTVRDAHP